MRAYVFQLHPLMCEVYNFYRRLSTEDLMKISDIYFWKTSIRISREIGSVNNQTEGSLMLSDLRKKNRPIMTPILVPHIIPYMTPLFRV